ncbi:MAG: sporulation integral membrane protein YtvI [Clostridia bacterium]|nr:sporulation integral membrane protein YtvI [Clostridia bacterium]
MADPRTEKRRAFIINSVYFCLIAFFIYFFGKAVVHALSPFLFALIVTAITRPLIRFLVRKWKWNRSFATIAVLILVFCILGVLVTVCVFQLISTGGSMLSRLPSYYMKTIQPAVIRLSRQAQEHLTEWFPQLEPTVDETVSSITGSIGNTLSRLSMNALSAVARLTTRLPRFLLNCIIAVVSTFFLSLDYSRITQFIMRQLPENGRHIAVHAKNELLKTVRKYLLSYLLLLLITYLELLLGFTIIGIRKAWLAALVVAIVAIIPVIGSGILLIPWAIVDLVVGNIRTGLLLLVLYIIITVIRNIVEPRIVGENVDLPPIVTLLAMVVGMYLFGFLGLFGLPICLAIIKQLNDQGVIHLYKSAPPSRLKTVPGKQRKRKKKKTDPHE